MIALILGTAIAVGALVFVMYPLFRGVEHHAGAYDRAARGATQEDAVAVLREIEFDRETGKLSEADCARLLESYSGAVRDQHRAPQPPHAVNALGAALGEAGAPGTTAETRVADAAEALISRFRGSAASCPVCGPRPEKGAAWCSNCGRYLSAKCASCGAAVEEQAARFCSTCGSPLTG